MADFDKRGIEQADYALCKAEEERDRQKQAARERDARNAAAQAVKRLQTEEPDG